MEICSGKGYMDLQKTIGQGKMYVLLRMVVHWWQMTAVHLDLLKYLPSSGREIHISLRTKKGWMYSN